MRHLACVAEAFTSALNALTAPDLGEVVPRGPAADHAQGVVTTSALQGTRTNLQGFAFAADQDRLKQSSSGAGAGRTRGNKKGARSQYAQGYKSSHKQLQHASGMAFLRGVGEAKDVDDREQDHGCHAPGGFDHKMSPGLSIVVCEHQVLYAMWLMPNFER